MNNILAICVQDFRVTYRDPVFKGLLVFPFIAFVIVRWGLPAVIAAYPPVQPYSVVILMWACMQSATMFGFIYGFLFLEEKEENINLVLQVMPVSNLRITFSRLLAGLVISSLVNFCLLNFGNIMSIPLTFEILLSVQFSLMAPLMALYLGSFAKNKIEGLAQMKIINILFIIPALNYFFPYKFLHVTAVIPTYWSFRSVENTGNAEMFYLFNIIGMIYYILLMLFFNYRMKKNNV